MQGSERSVNSRRARMLLAWFLVFSVLLYLAVGGGLPFALIGAAVPLLWLSGMVLGAS